MRPSHILLLAAALAALPACAAPAHQHGVAQLDVAVDATRVTLVLEIPLDSLLGFERAPRTDAERERVQAAIARLRAADGLFRIDSAAGCTLARVTLESAPLGLGAPNAAAAAADKEAHADLQAQVEFSCKEGRRAGHIEVDLFAAFANLRRIELQIAGARGQMKATLVKPATRVALVR